MIAYFRLVDRNTQCDYKKYVNSYTDTLHNNTYKYTVSC